MNTSHPAVPTPPVGAVPRFALLMALVLVVAATLAFADLVFSRSLRWGEHAHVEIWCTLAMPLEIEQAFDHMTVDPDDAVGPSLLSRLQDAMSRLTRWAWQVKLELKNDVAAVVTDLRCIGIARLPRSVGLAEGNVEIALESVAADGAVTITVKGQQSFVVRPGAGVDVALVAGSSPDRWEVTAADWRECIEQALLSGQRVGRLSIVNRGLCKTKPSKE